MISVPEKRVPYKKKGLINMEVILKKDVKGLGKAAKKSRRPMVMPVISFFFLRDLQLRQMLRLSRSFATANPPSSIR